MKKKIFMVCILVLAIVCIGCTAKPNQAENNTSKTEDGGVVDEREYAMEITTYSDYNKLAMEFSELVNDSDLIIKMRVKETKPLINLQGMIQTEIVPDIIEIIKGKYDNEKLFVNGGEILYDEFVANPVIQKRISGHEAPNGKDDDNRGKYVKQVVDNQNIIYPGEEYYFFATEKDNEGKRLSKYGYQGTFQVCNEKVSNNALANEEPLLKDIKKELDSELKYKTIKKAKAKTSASGIEELKVEILEQSFAEKIKQVLKNV